MKELKTIHECTCDLCRVGISINESKSFYTPSLENRETGDNYPEIIFSARYDGGVSINNNCLCFECKIKILDDVKNQILNN